MGSPGAGAECPFAAQPPLHSRPASADDKVPAAHYLADMESLKWDCWNNRGSRGAFVFVIVREAENCEKHGKLKGRIVLQGSPYRII